MTDRIVYSAVAVPNEPDWDGEILTPEEIRHAAHSYMRDYRIVDPDHTCALGKCVNVGDPVESFITDTPLSVKGYDGSVIDLPSGSWIIGIDVFDDTTFEQIRNGEKKGVSLTAKRGDDVTKSKRVLIRDLGDGWVARTVSIVKDPAVPKAKFFIRDDSMTEKENDAIESGFDKVVSAIKSLRNEDTETVDQQMDEEVDDVVKSTEDVEEEIEAVKEEEKVEDVPEVSYVTHDELAATKSEILEAIKSIKPKEDPDKDLRIVELENDIKELKNRLTSVKSKAIPDHYQEKEVIKSNNDDDNRDLYGRVIR